MVAVVLILWVLCAIGAGLFAHLKHRSIGAFALAGFLLGPIGLLWAAFANPEMSRADQRHYDVVARIDALIAEDRARPAAKSRAKKPRDLSPMRWPDDTK